ncbi:hypothetical protein [Streptomyces sp. TP-A0874]|uniref:hypothetical protein n=1 Tax=Streptomyces sp. TP-A0874 TaxID=549819 RepID=UPI000852D565|nr:hypothetical protein [Streptomyces sp. TP-A0874]
MVVVVVAVFSALVGTVLPIGDNIRDKICQALGGSCGSGGDKEASGDPNAKYQPTSCQTHSVASTKGGKANVSFMGWGAEGGVEYGFETSTNWVNRDTNGDGKIDEKDQETRITFTDAASVKGSFGAKAGVGNVGEAKVEIGAGIKVSAGDTWVFDSPEEAKEFQDSLERYQNLHRLNSSPAGLVTTPLGWAGVGPKAEEDKIKKELQSQLGKKHISTGQVSVDVGVEGGMQFGPGKGKKNNDGDSGGDGDGDDEDSLLPSAGAGAKVSMGGDVIWATDDTTGTKSYTFQARGEAGVNANVDAVVGEAHGEAKIGRTGAITMTVDQKTGELKSITMTQTIDKTLKGGASAKSPVGKGGEGKVGVDKGGSSIEVISTTVPFGPDADKKMTNQLTQDMLSGGAEDMFGYLFANAPIPETDPGDSDPWGHMLYESGVVSKTTYDNVEDASETGLDINLGIVGIGGAYTTSSTEKTVKEAEFLGAPDSDGNRSFVPFSECAS